MSRHRADSNMVTSSNGYIFHVTGPLWGEPPVTGGFPLHRLVTRSFDVFFNLRLNKRLSKQDAGDLRGHRAHYDVIVMNVRRVTRFPCSAWFLISFRWPDGVIQNGREISQHFEGWVSDYPLDLHVIYKILFEKDNSTLQNLALTRIIWFAWPLLLTEIC